MKVLSYWASRHVFASRFLLVVFGILKGCIGTIIGYGLLQNIPTSLMLGIMFGLIAVYKFAEWRYDRLRSYGKLTIERYFRVRYAVIGIMYTSLFGLYMFIGSAVFHYQAVGETAIQTINSIVYAPSVSVDKKEMKQIKRQHYYEKVMLKWQATLGKDADGMSKNGMIWLGILGIVLGILSVPLACGLACNNQEALAVIVLLLGIGCIVGAIILFVKAGRKGKMQRQKKGSSTSSV